MNQELLHQIDEIFTDYPFYGSPRITNELKIRGYPVNIKRVKRLMSILGIEAIYPKPNLSKRNQAHKIYPYLLRNVQIIRPDQVWSTDITYIRMKRGFMYLVAVIDWYSRFVLAWELSNTLDNAFCINALKRSFAYGIPDIFNTDQGVQFTSSNFTEMLLQNGIQISMDAKGRALDNIFIERLWRSVKYENIYLNDYETVSDLQLGLSHYFDFYNHRRGHQSLGWDTPSERYFGTIRDFTTPPSG